ncbi:MAG: substrate-binding domain-containing protein [Oscillospiraceae bacterium]|jgi:phosphate transport system substrate-binding protein|nr:substrate-binding domain-containing protein [Oscillospiraceae bacterium]
MKKALSFSLALALLLALASCGFFGNADKKITVITREDGSGTRSAFVELFGISEKDTDGKSTDATIDTAETVNNTGGVMVSVAGDPDSIAYISLGSLNGTVRALSIDGVTPTVAAVRDGSYTIQRPFNILTKGELSAAAQDFADFIMSREGQAVVADNGYIPMETTREYAGTKSAGKITIDGSSSVAPLMEKLIEAYEKLNPGAQIEPNTSDSTTAVQSTVNGTCNIGMSSRGLKDGELAQGARETQIAADGIVVIVNKNRTLTDASREQIKAIYSGEITKWSELE